ncbi:MAG: FecCD family ABC transporter permease [Candidatus Methanomethylophilaceae archaeon]|jgi:iron complex transport system permease protein
MVNSKSLQKKMYLSSARKKIMFILLCAILTVIVFIYYLKVGFYSTTMSDIFEIISAHFTGKEVDYQADLIIWGKRIPRAIMAVFCGASLAVGGAVIQTVLRNPLTDSYTTGISSGAFLGVTLFLILDISLIPSAQNLSLVFNAFLFSLIPVAAILVVSGKKRVTASRLILTGIAVMYLFSATSTLLMVSTDHETLSEAYSWRIGTLANTGWISVPIVVTVTVICILFLFSKSREFNIVSAGEKVAQSLGVNSKKVTVMALIVVAFMTASSVSFTGTIGFVGLVAPHISRIFIGSDCRYLIPASAFVGALFLLSMDAIAKVSGDLGLPVGVISALIGAPLFVIILVKNKKTAWDI